MSLPTEHLFLPNSRRWTDSPLGLVLKLLLALTLAAAYDAGTFLLALRVTTFLHGNWDIPQGIVLVGLAFLGQVLLLSWLLAKQRYALVGVVALSAAPLAYFLLLVLFAYVHSHANVPWR